MALGAALVAVGATPADAHTALKSSNPQNGARISDAPEVAELTFTGPLRAQLTKIVVRGPGDRQFQNGPAQVSSATVEQPLSTLAGPGTYEIVYRVVAADGHPLAGTVRFTVTAGTAGTAAPGAAPGANAVPTTETFKTQRTSASDPDDVPPWVLAIAGVALVACVAGAVIFGRRVTRGLD